MQPRVTLVKVRLRCAHPRHYLAHPHSPTLPPRLHAQHRALALPDRLIAPAQAHSWANVVSRRSQAPSPTYASSIVAFHFMSPHGHATSAPPRAGP
eukprot:5780700-Pleurochrysis_carterae.AAC.1